MLLTVLFIYACQNQDDDSPEIAALPSDLSKLIDYKGVLVNHRFPTPIESLEIEHTEKFLKQTYLNAKEKVALKKQVVSTMTTEELPDAETILEAAKKVFNQFPYGKIQEEYNEQITEEVEINKEVQENWEMIKKDFPTLTNHEIIKNIKIIDGYYAQNIDYVVLNEIANNEQEMANKVAQRNPQIGDAERARCVLKNYQSPWKFLIPPGFTSFTGSFSYTLSSISIVLATDQAQIISENYYGDLGASNTRRDAYRHITWSALLAQHYFTVSNKVKRIKFSEAVTYANEVCGENPVDAREMDYHNNEIGREMWDDYTEYQKTRFGWEYALILSSVSTLTKVAREYIDDKSCLIAKTKTDEFPYNLLTRDKTEEEIQAKILHEKYVHIPVYFEGSIAPAIGATVKIFIGYEEYDCNDKIKNRGYKQQKPRKEKCMRPIYRNEIREITSCYEL